jgi:hypothetical protein
MSKKNPKIQDKYKIGILLCATIKKLNRISVLRVNKARNKTCDVKNKIDEDHLELQNLLYEVSHIKKEINKCLEFRCVCVLVRILVEYEIVRIILIGHWMKTLTLFQSKSFTRMHQKVYHNRSVAIFSGLK